MIVDHITGMIVKIEHSQFGINLSYNLHLILSTSYIHNTVQPRLSGMFGTRQKRPVNRKFG